MEIDYELTAKCMQKANYDVSKRKIVEKVVKGVKRKFIMDYNSPETINAFNKCVEESDDTTENLSKTEINKIKNKDKLSETVPKALSNLPTNATFSFIGGLVLGKILKLNNWGIAGLSLAMFLSITFYDAQKVRNSLKNLING